TALNNDWETARRIHRQFLPLMQANFIESNPIPVKAALAMMGRIKEVYRLPMMRMKEDTRAKLHQEMNSVGLSIDPVEPAVRRVVEQAQSAVTSATIASAVGREAAAVEEKSVA